MRLIYTDKKGNLQVQEITGSDRIGDNVSIFRISGGFSSYPINCSVWESQSNDVEALMKEKILERYVMFEDMHNAGHNNIVHLLGEKGWCHVSNKYRGEVVYL